MIRSVRLSKRAAKQLRKVPFYISDSLDTWVAAVRADGLEQVRKIPGYHDEPLRGERKGQRSIRLSRSYRAIYQINKDGSAEFVSVEEVNKHEY